MKIVKAKWNAPQITDLTLAMTKNDLYAPGADAWWDGVNLNDCPIPPNIVGSGPCQGCPN